MRFHPNQTKKASVGNEDVQVLHWAAVGRQCKNISSTDRFHFYLVIRMSGVSFQITQHSNSFLFFSDNDFCIWFYHAMSVWIQVFQVLLIGFVWDSFVDSDSDIFWWSQAQWHDNEYEGDRFCYRYSFVSDQGGLREACGHWLVHHWQYQATASFYTRVENDLWAFILANLLWNSFISDWQILS